MSHALEEIVKLLKFDALDNIKSLKMIKQKTGINVSIIGLALLVFLIIISMVSSSAVSFVIGITCYLIPGYFSFLALQSPQKEDDIKFLTYWITFSLFEILSPILSWLISPFFYTLFRIILAVLLLHPSTNLSYKLYYQVIEPFLKESESFIDRGISKVENIVKDGKNKAIDQISKGLKTQ